MYPRPYAPPLHASSRGIYSKRRAAVVRASRSHWYSHVSGACGCPIFDHFHWNLGLESDAKMSPQLRKSENAPMEKCRSGSGSQRTRQTSHYARYIPGCVWKVSHCISYSTSANNLKSESPFYCLNC